MRQDKYEAYVAPRTEHTEVTLEGAIMSASVFEEEGHDTGLTIGGHETGNTIDASGDGWDISWE